VNRIGSARINSRPEVRKPSITSPLRLTASVDGLGEGVGAGVGLGEGVGIGVGVVVGEGVGDGDGLGVGDGVGLGVGVGDELGVAVGVGVGPTDISPHQVPQLLPVAAYSWSVHRVRSSSGSTVVVLKSPHRLSPVPKSLK